MCAVGRRAALLLAALLVALLTQQLAGVLVVPTTIAKAAAPNIVPLRSNTCFWLETGNLSPVRGLFALAESYPQLRASENFAAMQVA